MAAWDAQDAAWEAERKWQILRRMRMKNPYEDRIKELEGPEDYPDTAHSLYALSKTEAAELEALYNKLRGWDAREKELYEALKYIDEIYKLIISIRGVK